MSISDERPPVWVGHVAMHSEQVGNTADFMEKAGMRRIYRDDSIAVLELRGGTHLVVTDNPDSDLLRGSFDLMVDDLDATHARFVEQGFNPGEISRGEIHDHFEVREPGGTVVTFNSSHVGDSPV